MIGYIHPPNENQKQTGTHNHGIAQPQGRFVLIPAHNGTLLIKSIAVQELMLPCQFGNHTEEPSDESLNTISESLDQVMFFIKDLLE